MFLGPGSHVGGNVVVGGVVRSWLWLQLAFPGACMHRQVP